MKAENFIETLPSGVSFEMVFVEGGRFMMGSEDIEAFEIEKPVHQVIVPDFYIGKYLVTQKVWKTVMGKDRNLSKFKGENRPVEQISLHDVRQFLKELNFVTKKEYRLPSEAEWEYAAKGGQKSQGFKYSGSNKLKDVGWYKENSYGETKPVGLKYPNELGIFDMSGNIYEWVADNLHGTYIGAPKDGSVWLADGVSAHIIRGGGWNYSSKLCRVSARSYFDRALKGADYGFRLCLSFKKA